MRTAIVTLGILLTTGIWDAPARAAGNAPHVTFVPAAAQRTDLATLHADESGIALKTYFSTPGYSATLVRRTRAGNAEVHKNVSDVWLVINGGGTLVTDGALAGPRETEPGELRGARISGGTTRRIAKGDLIGIPAGIAHWVSAIDGGELVYLVVKVKTPAR